MSGESLEKSGSWYFEGGGLGNGILLRGVLIPLAPMRVGGHRQHRKGVSPMGVEGKGVYSSKSSEKYSKETRFGWYFFHQTMRNAWFNHRKGIGETGLNAFPVLGYPRGYIPAFCGKWLLKKLLSHLSKT